MTEDTHRLSKLMSQRGLCSRREADILIEQGLVEVDGQVVNTMGIKFPSSVEINLTEKAKKIQNNRITIMINKPVGYVSGQAEDDYVPAVRLVTKGNQSEIDQSGVSLKSEHFDGLAPAGRLDIDSQGLLVLTQDGRIAKQLIGADSDLEKEYLVRVDATVSKQQREQLTFGLELDGKALKRAKVRQINEQQLQIILREGKKRQIRRMCEAVGLHVSGLKRVRVGELRLGRLAEGEWRYVDAAELRHRSSKASSGKLRTRKGKPFETDRDTGSHRNRVSQQNEVHQKVKGKSLYGLSKRKSDS